MKTVTPDSIHIEKRVIGHRFGADIPRFWANGNPVISCFFNALSSVIPRGERFFIHTVQQAADRVGDPALKGQVRGFIAQESQHRVGHGAMNDWVAAQGYPIERVELGVERMLGLVERHLSHKYQLSLTVALEHFSCLLSDRFLRAEALQAGLHPEVQQFLVAHCIEEIEHKAVAFDVYQEAYGDYFARIFMMLFVTLVFAPNVFRIQFIYLLHDRQLFNVKAWLQAVRFFWFKPGWFGHTIPGYLAYYRPGFHPWQHDNSQLVSRYLTRLSQGKTAA